MQKLFYLANIRFPTERAHGIQTAKMCEAFARRGLKVTLIVPARKTFSVDPYAYYGVERNFDIERIKVPDIVSLSALGFFIESMLFAFRAAKRVRNDDAIVYSREEYPFWFLQKDSAFYEAHQLRRDFLSFIKHAKGILSISQGLKNALVKKCFPEERICVAPDGFDAKQFAVSITKEEARKRISPSLPLDEKIAMYIGGLESWKGAETLCRAAQRLKQDGIAVCVIGGTEKETERFSMAYPHVRFLGARPYTELPLNQQAADVLVIPNSAHTRISREFTSPLKLFAHMASGVPIVASALPSIREVLSERNAFLVRPDDPQALAEGIRFALFEAGVRRAVRAREEASRYTWDARAKLVLDFISDVEREK